MTRRTYRYRGRWNRRARNAAKLHGTPLGPVWFTNSRRCRDSKDRYEYEHAIPEDVRRMIEGFADLAQELEFDE